MGIIFLVLQVREIPKGIINLAQYGNTGFLSVFKAQE